MAVSQRARLYPKPYRTLPYHAPLPRALSDSSIIPAAGRLCLKFFTDPPRILEPGKWGSKVRGLAHVQGYRGPQGYAFWNLQVPVPNLSTASRVSGCQVPNLSTSSRFFKHFIFRFAVGRKIVKLGGDRDVGINDGDAMPERSAENQPPQTHSARDHVPPAETYVPSIWSLRI